MTSNYFRKAARRKQQTRLTFDPVNQSSSPAASLSPAKVRYEMSGEKRQTRSSTLANRSHEEEESDGVDMMTYFAKEAGRNAPIAPKRTQKALPFKILPTPAPSSQSQINTSVANDAEEAEDADESDALPPQTRQTRSMKTIPQPAAVHNKKKRRGYGGFDGTYSSSDGSEPEDNEDLPSRRQFSSGAKKKSASSTPVGTPTPSRRKTSTSRTVRTPSTLRRNAFVNLISSEEESSRASPEKKNTAQKQLSSADHGDEDDGVAMSNPHSSKLHASSFNVANSSSSSPPRTSRQRGKKIVVSSTDEDEDIVAPEQRRNRTSVGTGEDDSGTIPSRSSPSISKLKIQTTPKRHRKPVETSDSDINPSSLKRRRGTIRTVEEDSDDDLPSIRQLSASAKRNTTPRGRQSSARRNFTPGSRQLSRSTNRSLTPRRNRQSSTSSATSKTPPRYTRLQRAQDKPARKPRTERQKNLLLLERRRNGEKIEAVTDSASELNDDDEDSESDLEVLDVFNDEEDSPEQPKKSNKNPRRSSDDFIVEDDEDDLLGAPDLCLVPLQFTHAAHKPMKEHFKDIIEWMVQNKVNPGFERNDPIYLNAFQKIESETTAYADSKFVSTQWTQAFTIAIRARPVITFRDLNPNEGIEVLGENKCEVCNHRAHIPKYCISFSGKPYHQNSLIDVDQESSDEEDEDDDEDEDEGEDKNACIDELGRAVPAETFQWFSGSTCKSNAEHAHNLIHWKYHMNTLVIGQLENDGYCDAAELVKREKMTAKQRLKFALGIVDKWEADGNIKDLYRSFKALKDTARSSEGKRYGVRE